MVWIRKLGAYWNKPQHAAYLFILPAFLVVVLFNILPLGMSLIIGLFDITSYFSGIRFIGLDNFAEAFHDKYFLHAWKVTGVFTLFDVPINMLFSLLVAALISGEGRKNKMLRSVYILPLICSATVIGIMWKIFFNGTVGWGVYVLQQAGLPRMAVFSDPKLAIGGIIFVSIWKAFGITSLMIMAAMQGIAQTLYEAAKLDGAGAFQRFRYVTLPGISSTLWFVFITRVISSFQVFDLVYAITNGGPARSTETVVSYIYNTSFQINNRLGYATAMSEVLFAVILLVSILLYFRMLKGERDGGGEV